MKPRTQAQSAIVIAVCCALHALAEPVHVVVVGVDGLSPDGIRRAHTPELDILMRDGAFSFHARAVMPTSSSPNWADWDGFGRLLEPQAVDRLEDTDGPTNAVRQAIAFFLEKRPALTFIHLDHVDHAGHEFGHGTPEYYASVEVADRLIGETIAGLRSADMWDHTLIMVTSDHGGIGKGHGGATLAEIEIPWIMHGPGVARGRTLRTSINVYDTAATIAEVLGLQQPDCWIARPVVEAFTHPLNTQAHSH